MEKMFWEMDDEFLFHDLLDGWDTLSSSEVPHFIGNICWEAGSHLHAPDRFGTTGQFQGGSIPNVISAQLGQGHLLGHFFMQKQHIQGLQTWGY